MLQVRSSSNRRVKVLFLGFNVLVSRVFCRFHVSDLQFVEKMGGGVLPGFQCLGPSLGWGGGVASGCLSCDVM